MHSLAYKIAWPTHWRLPHASTLVLLVLLRVGLLVYLLLSRDEVSSRWIGRAALLDLVLVCWLLQAWWLTRAWHIAWMVGLVAVLGTGGLLWATGFIGLAVAVFGMACMAVGVALSLAAIRAALTPGIAILGVARTLIDEALRMKTALGFIFALMLLIPILPALFDDQDLLSHRIQTFLRMSLSGAALMMSLMTLFLACASLCNDFRHRQILLTLTKPISRIEYLLGKWLGIALLNLILVSVVGGGIYVFARVLEKQTAVSTADRDAVRQRVLTARVAVPAAAPVGLDMTKLFEARLALLRAENPDNPVYQGELAPEVRRAIQQAILTQWHTIQPRDFEVYLFTGLNQAKLHGESIQLRLRPQSLSRPPDQRVHLILAVNDRPFGAFTLADGIAHVIDLPVSVIRPDGSVEIRIANINAANPNLTYPSSVSFSPGRGLQVLYQAGGFAPNLIRAMAVIWVRLAYLAMLGLAAATFLSFPVACLLSLLVYFTASASGFLIESMQHYTALPSQDLTWSDHVVATWNDFFDQISSENGFWEAIKIPVRVVGHTFVALTPSFSQYNPVPPLADGLLVESRMLGRALLNVGLLWTSCCALVGWLIFRRRELASITA